jgi:hypothetical protein
MYYNVEVIVKICPGAWEQLTRSIDASNCVMSSAFRAFPYPVTRPWAPEDSMAGRSRLPSIKLPKMPALRSRTILGCRPFSQELAAVDVEALSRCMLQVHNCSHCPPKPRNVIHEHLFIGCKLEEVVRHKSLAALHSTSCSTA